MELHPPEIDIDIDSHPQEHGSLKLRPAEKSYYCGGCKEMVFVSQQCYQCDHQKCDFHLHEECVPAVSLWLTFISCDLTFEQDSRGKNMVCDACGKDVKGWFYQGFSRKKQRRYLHPCCAKIDFKREIKVDNGSIVLDLKEETSSVCLICRNQGHSKYFRSWVYVSRCRNYCYHVSCMKDKVEKGAKDVARTNQKPSNEIETSRRALVTRARNQDVQARRGQRVGDLLELAVEIVIFVISVIFGIPLPSVGKWIRKVF